MNEEDFWKDLKNIGELINNEPILVGVVANPRIKSAIKNQLPNMIGGRRLSYNPIPIYAFEDVPTDDSVLFYDRKQLTKYLEEREQGKDHMHALGSVMIEKKETEGIPEQFWEDLEECAKNAARASRNKPIKRYDRSFPERRDK